LISSRSSHGRSADFLAILSGHFWNESIIRFTMDGQGWRKPKNEATFLAKRAVALDPSVVQRSPFLHSVLGNKAAVRNADKLRHSAPRRVAGFALGWSSTEAREACTIEDLDFKAKQGGGLCSEPPTADSFTGPVVLKFKNDQIVRVDVIDRPSRALSKVWVRDFKNLYAQFKERYGKHDKQEVNVPSPCRNNLLTCLREGKARLSYQWLWGGRRLTLWLGRRDGKAAMVVSLMDESLRSRSSRIVAQAPSSH
jgi:hypothetical protein